MAAHSDSLPTVVPLRFLRVSGAVLGGLVLLALVGAALAFLTGAGDEHGRLWLAIHFNWLFWSSVALGMVIFAMALHITNARWSWSLRRFALGGVAFLPISFVLWFVQFFGGYHYYFHHWLDDAAKTDPIIQEKALWLSVPGMAIRDTLALVVLYGMALWFARNALRPDLHGIREGGLYGFITKGYRGAGEEAIRSRDLNFWIAPITAILFALLWGMIAIDQAMTMLPHWFSTMFPVTFLVSAFHSALAMTAIGATLGRRNAGLQDYITTRQYHDLGKLLFAYAVFWMYVNWSQYVVIWYGLLPHEQEFFVRRFNEPFGGVSQLMVGMVFVIPFFFLLTRPPKKVPGFVAFVAAIILVGHWLERFLITVPSVWSAYDLKVEPGQVPLPMGLPEIGTALAFGGLFFACYLWFLKTFPLLPSPATLAAIPRPILTVRMPTTGARPATEP